MSPQGFVISFPYDPKLVEAVKVFEGRRYEPGRKCWTVPLRHAAAVSAFAVEHDFGVTDAAQEAISRPAANETFAPQAFGVTLVGDSFYLKFKYSPALVEAVKKIEGRRWNPDEKMWSIPLTSVRATKDFCERFGLPVDVFEGIPDADPVIEPEITKSIDGYYVRFAYDRDLVQRIKEVPTARFDRGRKLWVVSNSAKEDLIDFAEETSAHLDPTIEVSFADAADRRRRFMLSLATDSDLDIPALNGELKPFQRAGVRFALDSLGYIQGNEGWARDPARSKRGVLIADEQGLGKTVQSLATVEAVNAYPLVVVAPTSVRLNWRREIEKWLPHRSVTVAYGTEPHDISADICVVGWDTLHGWAGQVPVVSAVFDEAHYAKNPASRRTQAAFELSSRAAEAGGFSLALTGTPILNKVEELKSLLQMIGRIEELGGSRGFDYSYVKNKEPDHAGLHRRLRETCYLRRLKRDVLSELGDKEFVSVYVVGDRATMSEYRLAEHGLKAELGEELKALIASAAGNNAREREEAAIKTFRQNSGSHLARIEHLRQLAARAKRDAISEWLGDFTSSEKKLVVFGWHRDDVDWVANTYGNGLKIVGGMSDEAKQTAVQRFQEQDDAKLISCSLKAAGVGITLTAASDVLFIEQGWNPADMDQAADRCHRIGQRDSVTVYTLLCEETIDLRIAELIDQKRRIVNAVVDSRFDDVDEVGSIATAVLEQYAREGWSGSAP